MLTCIQTDHVKFDCEKFTTMSKRKLEAIPNVGDVPHQPKEFCFPDRKFGMCIGILTRINYVFPIIKKC